MAKSTKSTTSTATTVNRTKVMRSVASSIEFIKSQIANDLMTAKNNKMIDLSIEDLQKVSSLVEASISNSFVKTSGQIETQLK